MFAELLSTLVSLIIFVLNFRTPFVKDGEKSIECENVARIYFKNGLIPDLFGVIPLNIVLDFSFNLMGKNVSKLSCCIVGFFRCTRMISVIRAVTIFEIIKL